VNISIYYIILHKNFIYLSFTRDSVDSRKINEILLKRKTVQVKEACANRHVIHIETWSDTLVGTDNTGLCEVVAECKAHNVDAT